MVYEKSKEYLEYFLKKLLKLR